MPQTFHCPACHASLDHSNTEGNTVRCPYCHTSVIVPDSLRRTRSGVRSDQDIFTDQSLEALAEMTRLARGDRKIEAIKLYRDEFGGDLAEAKDVVDRLSRGEMVQWGDASVVDIKAVTAKFKTDVAPELAKTGRKAAGGCLFFYLLALAVMIAGGIVLYALVSNETSVSDIPVIGEPLSGVLESAEEVAESNGLSGVGAPEANPTLQAASMIVSALAGNTQLSLPQKQAALAALNLSDEELAAVVAASDLSPAQQERFLAEVNTSLPIVLVMQFGEEGINPGQFSDTRYLATDAENNIYTADFSDGRVQAFGPDGTVLGTWIHDLDTISAFEVNRSGHVHILSRDSVFVYDGQTGELLQTINNAGVRIVIDMVVAPDGSMIVYGGDTILRYNADFVVTERIDNLVSAVDEDAYSINANITVDGLNNIYLGSSAGLWKFNADGTFVDKIATSGSDADQVGNVRDLAVDGQGNLLVTTGSEIKIFETDGRGFDSVRIRGAVFALDINELGQLVVMDRNSNSVTVYEIVE